MKDHYLNRSDGELKSGSSLRGSLVAHVVMGVDKRVGALRERDVVDRGCVFREVLSDSMRVIGGREKK